MYDTVGKVNLLVYGRVSHIEKPSDEPTVVDLMKMAQIAYFGTQFFEH